MKPIKTNMGQLQERYKSYRLPQEFMEKVVFSGSGKVYRKPKIIRTMLTKEEFKKAIVLYDERNV